MVPEDILRAVHHLHLAEYTPALRNHSVVPDFGSYCPSESPNYHHRIHGYPIPKNGLAKEMSERTDMFAIGPLIYELETKEMARLWTEEDGALILPEVSTGHGSIDAMIQNAWLGRYDSSAQMLAHAESLQSTVDSRPPLEYPVSNEELRARIQRWREMRLEQYGQFSNQSSNQFSEGPGLGKALSQGTDMFAMGSLVYEIETEKRAELFVDNENGALFLPEFSRGHGDINSVVRNAWLGHYASTAQMLADIESLADAAAGDSQGPIEYPVSKEQLPTRVTQWREMRLKQHGEAL